MKLLTCLATLALVGCAEFAGNGITLSAQYTEPTTGATVELKTAK